MIQWAITKLFGTAHERELKRIRPLIEQINALEPRISVSNLASRFDLARLFA